MKLIIRITALLLVIITALAFCACGKGGDKAGRPTEFDGKQSVDALVDYAKRLEEMGASKAAAQIYAMLPEAALGEMFNVASKIINENEGFAAIESLAEAMEFVNALKEESDK